MMLLGNAERGLSKSVMIGRVWYRLGRLDENPYEGFLKFVEVKMNKVGEAGPGQVSYYNKCTET